MIGIDETWEEINRMDHASKAAALALLGKKKRLLKILEEKQEDERDCIPAPFVNNMYRTISARPFLTGTSYKYGSCSKRASLVKSI